MFSAFPPTSGTIAVICCRMGAANRRVLAFNASRMDVDRRRSWKPVRLG
jgi:hypothetical protein